MDDSRGWATEGPENDVNPYFPGEEASPAWCTEDPPPVIPHMFLKETN